MAGRATEIRERELKLDVDDGYALPSLAGEPLEPRSFLSTYWDTSSHRLARAGITLRRRLEGGKSAWQLKLPRGEERSEIELAGGPRPPRQLVEALAAATAGEELAPLASLRTRRSGTLAFDGKRALAEVVLDEVAILDGRRIAGRFRELEVEAREGDAKALARIARDLRRAGARPGDGLPKVMRAVGLDYRPAAPEPGAPPLEHVRAMLQAQHHALLARDPALRLLDDPEDVHQLRVATRRLRAVLRAARPLLDQEWADALSTEIGWLTSAAGPVRDLDVLCEHLRSEGESLEPPERRAIARLVSELEREREEHRAALLADLRSPRYLELLARIEQAAAEPRVRETGTTLKEIAAGEFRRLRKTVRALGAKPSDDELHGVRIRGKRARYAAELAERAVGKPAAEFVRAAKEFQDVVGEHQDAVVAAERLRELARRGGAVRALAAGRLIERQVRRRRAARARFGETWKALDRAGRKAWW